MDEEILFVMFMLGISGLVTGMGVALHYTRKELRRLRGDAESRTDDPRMDRLEQAVDAIAMEVERLAEGQQYTVRLLSDRQAREAPNPVSGKLPPR